MENPCLSKETDLTLLKDISLLYVEDDDDARLAFAELLKRKVGVLYTASNGKEGLALFKKHMPDLVLTDLAMPVMGGLAMAEAIRKLKCDVPVIIITAYNEQDFFMKAIEIGIDKYVMKPVDINILLDTLVKSAADQFTQKELALKNNYIQFVLDTHASFVIATTGSEVEYMNRSFLKYLGFESLEDFKKSHASIDNFITQIDGIVYPAMDNKNWLRYILEEPDMEHVVYLRSVIPQLCEERAFLLTCNKAPELERYIISLTDITRLEQEKTNLIRLSTTDHLTGIFNRAYITQALSSELERSRRYNTPTSLIMFDIDHFKKINDTYGHPSGDEVLKGLAAIVSDNLRSTDIFGRWGGEEFMILAPQTDIEHAGRLSEKLRAAIEMLPFNTVGPVTCSFGVTVYRKDDTFDSIAGRVDAALYESKAQGRNRTCIR